MTTTPVTLSLGGQLAATSGLLTAPQTTIAVVTSAVFTNTDTAVHTVTVNVVRASGASGPANVIIPAQVLAPGQQWSASALSLLVLNVGDVLTGFADAAAKVNCWINGYTL